jgi:hypothetical protein
MVAGCADSTRPDALQHAQLGTDCKACESALGEMRERVRELRHKLQRTQEKLYAYKRGYERQSYSASAPSEDRGSPLRLAEREAVNSQWMVHFVQQMQQLRRPIVLPILPSPGASSKNRFKVRIPPKPPNAAKHAGTYACLYMHSVQR